MKFFLSCCGSFFLSCAFKRSTDVSNTKDTDNGPFNQYQSTNIAGEKN